MTSMAPSNAVILCSKEHPQLVQLKVGLRCEVLVAIDRVQMGKVPPQDNQILIPAPNI